MYETVERELGVCRQHPVFWILCRPDRDTFVALVPQMIRPTSAAILCVGARDGAVQLTADLLLVSGCEGHPGDSDFQLLGGRENAPGVPVTKQPFVLVRKPITVWRLPEAAVQLYRSISETQSHTRSGEGDRDDGAQPYTSTSTTDITANGNGRLLLGASLLPVGT